MSATLEAVEVASGKIAEDSILEYVGKFGRFQRLYAVWIMGITWFFCGAHTLIMVFTSYHPHRYLLCDQAATEPAGLTVNRIDEARGGSLLTSSNYTETTVGYLKDVAERKDPNGFGQNVSSNKVWKEQLRDNLLPLRLVSGRQLVDEPVVTACDPSIELNATDCSSLYRYKIPHLTIVSEWNLDPCSSSSISAEMTCSAFFVGFLIGVSVLGIVSDYFGRRFSLCISWCFMQFGGLACVASPNVAVYAAFRCLTGIGVGGSGMACYVLLAEIVTSDYRQLITGFHGAFFAMGASAVAFSALLVPDWRVLTLLSAVPGLLLFLTIPTKLNIESPRWYSSKCRHEEALAAWQTICLVNTGSFLPASHTEDTTRTTAPPSETTKKSGIHSEDTQESLSDRVTHVASQSEVISERQHSTSSSDNILTVLPAGGSARTMEYRKEGIQHVCRTHPFSVWLGILMAMWYSCSVVYYGLSLYIGNGGEPSLGGGNRNPHGHSIGIADEESSDSGMKGVAITLLFSFLLEVPVLFAAVFLADVSVIGRKGVAAGGLILSGTLCIASYGFRMLVPRVSSYATVAARLVDSGAFTVLYLYSAEIFPTTVRGAASGIMSLAARIAGISAPLLVKLDENSKALPVAIFGVVALVAGICGLRLPETLNRKLYNTLHDQKQAIDSSRGALPSPAVPAGRHYSLDELESRNLPPAAEVLGRLAPTTLKGYKKKSAVRKYDKLRDVEPFNNFEKEYHHSTSDLDDIGDDEN